VREQPQEVHAPVCRLHVLGNGTTILIVSTVCSATTHRRAGSQCVARVLTRSRADRIDNHFSAGDHAFACSAATTATTGTWLIALTTHRADATATTSVSTRRQAGNAASTVRAATTTTATTTTATAAAAANGTTQWGTELIVRSRGSLREREAERWARLQWIRKEEVCGDADLDIYSCCFYSGAPHGELGPSTQVARRRVLEHATAAGHREVSVLFFCDTNHGID
jgi:hypothetical protein